MRTSHDAYHSHNRTFRGKLGHVGYLKRLPTTGPQLNSNPNPYAPPTSVVADVPAASVEGASAIAFFPASVTKVVVLSFCTLGLYQYYWFYRNWKIIRDRTNEGMYPFWRAFFVLFFCHSLFKRIREYRSDLPASSLGAGPLAAVWIVLTLLWKLPDPYWLVSYLPALVLVPVQRAINSINLVVAPAHEPNSRFSAWNWVTVALGGPFFLLVIYAAMSPAAGG